MQGNLGHASAASDGRAANRLALFAGVPLIAALAFSAPSLALAACGASHPAFIRRRLRERRQRSGAARLVDRQLRQSDRRQSPSGGARGHPCSDRRDEDRKRQRAFARSQAGAPSLRPPRTYSASAEGKGLTLIALARRRACQRS